ncbi:MAG: hypothetical protein R3F19_11785 [Verrucomicrobiales bacterium]
MRFLCYLSLLVCAMLISGAYGAIHDQISFTVSSEYFTKFKYQQFGFVGSPLPDRAKVAVIGFLASWWMGIPIGGLVGAFGFLHRPASAMFVKTLRALGIVAIVALLGGLGGLTYGWFFASHEVADYSGWFLPEDLVSARNFLSVGHMHNCSYLGGGIGLFVGIAMQCLQRSKHPR